MPERHYDTRPGGSSTSYFIAQEGRGGEDKVEEFTKGINRELENFLILSCFY